MNTLTRIVKAATRLSTWPLRQWRRMLLIMALFAAVIALLYTVTDQVLLHRLDAQQAEMKRLGVPLNYEEYQFDKILSEDNAAIIYRYVISKIMRDYNDKLDWQLLERLAAGLIPKPEDDFGQTDVPLTPEEFETAARQMAQLTPLLEQVREALPLKTCLFSDSYTSAGAAGSVSITLPGFSRLRLLCRYLTYKALVEYRQGNTQAAYDWLALALHLANDLRHEPILMAGIIRAACATISLNALHVMLYNGDIPDTIPPGLTQELNVLTDRASLKQMMQGERCFAQAYRGLMLPSMSRFSRPRQTLEHLKTNEIELRLADALGATDYKTRQAFLEPIRQWLPNAPFFLYGSSILIAQSMTQTVSHFDSMIARAQMASLTLALKQHKQQNGQYPGALSDLVPALIPELPKDPGSGGDYIYQRTGDGFTLCSAWTREKGRPPKNITCTGNAPSGLCVCVIN